MVMTVDVRDVKLAEAREVFSYLSAKVQRLESERKEAIKAYQKLEAAFDKAQEADNTDFMLEAMNELEAAITPKDKQAV